MTTRDRGLHHHLSSAPREWIRRLLQIGEAADGLAVATKINHTTTLTPVDVVPAPGLGPTPIVSGTIVGLEFGAAADKAYTIQKIDPSYVGEASFHVHWTKSGDVDESGKTVRWKLSYVVYDNDITEVALVTPQVVTCDHVYTDSGTTTRFIYRTPDFDAPGFVAGHYVGYVLEYDPAGTTLTSNPVVISVDLLWRGSIFGE